MVAAALLMQQSLLHGDLFNKGFLQGLNRLNVVEGVGSAFG
jgi:hypothetical protein